MSYREAFSDAPSLLRNIRSNRISTQHIINNFEILKPLIKFSTCWNCKDFIKSEKRCKHLFDIGSFPCFGWGCHDMYDKRRYLNKYEIYKAIDIFVDIIRETITEQRIKEIIVQFTTKNRGLGISWHNTALSHFYNGMVIDWLTKNKGKYYVKKHFVSRLRKVLMAGNEI